MARATRATQKRSSSKTSAGRKSTRAAAKPVAKKKTTKKTTKKKATSAGKTSATKSAKKSAAKKSAKKKSTAKSAKKTAPKKAKASRSGTKATKKAQPKASAQAKPRASKGNGKKEPATSHAESIVSKVFDHAQWDWSLERSDAEKYFLVNVPEGEPLGIHAELYEDDQRLVLYTTFLTPSPKRRRTAMMELLTRANFGLVSGNFEMDLDSGYVRFKSTADYADTALDMHWVKNLILHSIEATDAYASAVDSVMHGTASAREAIVDIEGRD